MAQRGGTRNETLCEALRACIKRVGATGLLPLYRSMYSWIDPRVFARTRARTVRVPVSINASSRCPSHCPYLCTLYFQLTPFNTVSCHAATRVITPADYSHRSLATPEFECDSSFVMDWHIGDVTCARGIHVRETAKRLQTLMVYVAFRTIPCDNASVTRLFTAK